jgi:mono/diheme cytochrome c family protein
MEPEAASTPPQPVSPHISRTASGWLEPVALFFIVFVCMTGGWFFFRGPGSSIFSRAAPARPKEKAATVIAEAAPPKKVDETKTLPPPGNPPVVRQTPAAVPPPPPPTQPPAANVVTRTFASDVRPIFQRKCISCHGGGKIKGGLDLRTVPAILAGGESGSSIKPGDPARSLLWESIATNKMPPSRNKLTEAERKIVQDWIAGGAK